LSTQSEQVTPGEMLDEDRALFGWAGKIGYASEQADRIALAIQADIFANFQVTREKAQIKKRLAPLVPTMIWCIDIPGQPENHFCVSI
jgi:hypothetical protein